MEIKLQVNDRFRIYGDYAQDNFVDISRLFYDAMAIDLHTASQYIEIRCKESQVRVFTFKKKSHKKECDLGWWEDAEVILAINEQTMNK